MISTFLYTAETVIGYFGFDRSVYGNKKDAGPRKWKWLETGKRVRYKGGMMRIGIQ
jgi:hypothetical protein